MVSRRVDTHFSNVKLWLFHVFLWICIGAAAGFIIHPAVPFFPMRRHGHNAHTSLTPLSNQRNYDYYSDDFDSPSDPARLSNDRGQASSNSNEPYELPLPPLDWEVCADDNNNALVLLPPESVLKPTAVIHFVGGAAFGTTPKVFYRSFLENLVRETNAAVIATPLPILRSPLDHVSLSKSIQSSFDFAWYKVLEDEYGASLADIPLCGLGHSLGARLLVVLNTMTGNQGTDRIPPYKSMVLMSFTNQKAEEGIPGLAAVVNQIEGPPEDVTHLSREQEYQRGKQLSNQWDTLGNGQGSNEFVDGDLTKQFRRLVGSFQSNFQGSSDNSRQAVLNDLKQIDFHPNAARLWSAILQNQRYNIPETLLVQFAEDTFDQSAELAQALMDSNSTSLMYARLPGSHVAPLSFDLGDTVGSWGLSPQTPQRIWEAISSADEYEKSTEVTQQLHQSVARYITDIVVPTNTTHS